MKYLFFDVEGANCYNYVAKMCTFGYVITDNDFNYFDNNSSKLIVSYGRVTAEVINAVEQLKGKGVDISIVSLNKSSVSPGNPTITSIPKKTLGPSDTSERSRMY